MQRPWLASVLVSLGGHPRRFRRLWTLPKPSGRQDVSLAGLCNPWQQQSRGREGTASPTVCGHRTQRPLHTRSGEVNCLSREAPTEQAGPGLTQPQPLHTSPAPAIQPPPPSQHLVVAPPQIITKAPPTWQVPALWALAKG